MQWLSVVAVHGLSGHDRRIWEGNNRPAKEWRHHNWEHCVYLETDFENSRLRNYSYSILDMQANIFVREGVRTAALKFLEALCQLRQGSKSKIMLVGHDFGGILIKEVEANPHTGRFHR